MQRVCFTWIRGYQWRKHSLTIINRVARQRGTVSSAAWHSVIEILYKFQLVKRQSDNFSNADNTTYDLSLHR